MKFLIATGLYPPDIGGPATYTVFLEKHANALGMELIVVPFGSVRAYPPIIRHLVYLAKLIVKGWGCDVLYALDTISVGVPAMLASIMTRKPLMLRVPGDYAWEQGQQRYGVTETLDEFLTHRDQPFPVRVMSWLQARVAQHATHVVVPSDYMKGVVSGWGVAPDHITRIYSVLKEIEVVAGSTPKVFTPGETFVVTTAARLVPWKGIHTLIDVVAAIHADGIPIELRIMGDGVCRAELEERARAKGAGDHIHFLGAIPRDQLGREIRASHAFVLNTSYEGLSHQLIEVMSLGVPIITTPVGGNVELIVHEQSGLMVPYNDGEGLTKALMRLREDGTLRTRLATHAREQLDAFRETTVVTEIKKLLHRLHFV